MRTNKYLRTSVFSTALLGLSLGGGCAEERDAINRVQPYALDKSFFVGPDIAKPEDDPEFLWRNYVIDGSVSQSLIGIGSWSGVDRIRWEITEDRLIGRRSFQWMTGADDKAQPEKTPDGTKVAEFKILSHFDIRNAYNPSTGEELNVIEENTSDRAWYERQYMRVDWSQNLVDSPIWQDMFVGKLFGEISLSPGTDWVNDPGHKYAPHFEPEQGYFDITQRYWVEPAESWFWPGVPTCIVVGIYTGSNTYECDAQEAIVRSSFVRVNPDHDFERLEITRAPGDIVGNPAAIELGGLLQGLAPPGQQGWDPGYGFTDMLYHRFAHIHNLWKRSHLEAKCTIADDLDNDGTSDECQPSKISYQGSLGSQCDTFVNRCTIPYRDREIRTVGYWFNDQMPVELQDTLDDSGQPVKRGAAEDVIESWNKLMKSAVALAREVECRRTGGDRDACHAEFFGPEKQMVGYGAWLVDVPLDETPVLASCHTPVRSYDHAACGKAGDVARLGDIRKNFLVYWPHESRAPWGGIGNWGADPLTGEIRGAAALVMGRSATRAAAYQRDIVQVALGDLSIEDVTSGVPATNYVHQLQNGHSPKALSQDELEKRVSSIDAVHAMQSVGPVAPEGSNVAQKLQALVEMQKSTSHDVDALSTVQMEFDTLADTLRGTPYEAQLTDGQWLTSVAAMSPDTAVTDEVLEAFSPLRGMDPGTVRTMRERVATMMGAKGVCFNDHEAPAIGSVELQGMARYFAQKYPIEQYSPTERGKLIYDELWVESFKGIAIHEVGHSLGLLHNFASSYDSPNFHPQYWQLRTHDGQSTASCNGVPRSGDVENDTCMGPRYLDPETSDEAGMGSEPRPGINYFANTSVMEYTLERFGETVGLGQYDFHAMKTLYGRVLETFEDAERGGLSPEEQMRLAPRLETQLTEYDRVRRTTAPFQGQDFAKPTHYTELARIMKAFDPAQCRDATEEEKAQGTWRIVHGKVCAPAPRDHAAWRDFQHGQTDPAVEASLAPFMSTRADLPGGGGKVRWYYRYGATNNSYFHTQLSDAGADAYEVTMNTVKQFDAVYPWRYFRQQNREFFAESLPFAASRVTFERLRAYHWNVANRNAFLRTFGEGVWNEIAGSDDWHRPSLVAETEMFGALARYILTPEPGSYGATTPVGSTRPIYDVATQNGQFSLGAVDSRFVGDEFNNDPDAGGSWNYLHWMRHAGFGVEKIFSTMALADGRPVLMTITRQNYLDGRAVKINFRNDMPEAVDRLLGGVLSEDWETVGMYVDMTTETPAPKMTPLHLVGEMPSRPQNVAVLYPNVGYKQQLGMLIFAHVYSRMNSDMALSNKLRLWIDGQVGELDVPPEQQVRFYDPESGYTYIARKYGPDVIDNKTVDAGIASRMIQHANDLVIASYEVVRDTNGAPVLNEYGAPTVVTDSFGQPVLLPADESRIADLNNYVGVLDAARQIASRVGYGPL